VDTRKKRSAFNVPCLIGFHERVSGVRIYVFWGRRFEKGFGFRLGVKGARGGEMAHGCLEILGMSCGVCRGAPFCVVSRFAPRPNANSRNLSLPVAAQDWMVMTKPLPKPRRLRRWHKGPP
jgi:hypothetical protein